MKLLSSDTGVGTNSIVEVSSEWSFEFLLEQGLSYNYYNISQV